MRNNNEITLGEAIRNFLQQYKLKHKYNEVRLVSSWEKIMGKVISNRTDKIFIREKVLHIHLSSASLKQELTYAKGKIINLVNSEAGEEIINDVKIV